MLMKKDMALRVINEISKENQLFFFYKDGNTIDEIYNNLKFSRSNILDEFTQFIECPITLAEFKNLVQEFEIQSRNKEQIKAIETFIYSKYPLEKQTQDEKWVSSYSTKLKALEVKDLELTIVRMAEDVYAGKTLEEVLQDIPQEQKKMYEKLVKVAVRTQWMEDCIEEGHLAIEQNKEPNFDAITYLNV